MLKKRIIPVLFLKNGLIVRSQEFYDFRELGNPIHQLQRLNDWLADEVVYINITREGAHDLKRDDQKIKSERDLLKILQAISKQCFMPLTFGGRISSFEDAAAFIANGADKVIVNSYAYRHPTLITDIAKHFGSQCVVVGVDVKRKEGGHRLYIDQGETSLDLSPMEWARKVADLGAGEIFLNSIDRDGTASGFDLEIIQKISDGVRIPVIACGGAGDARHFKEVLEKTNVSAIAAGNIFNFTENAYIRIKKELLQAHFPVKP